MVKVCAVKNCPSGRKNKKKINGTPHSVSFFQSTTPGRLENWTKALGFDLKASDYICQLHFKEEHIKMYDKIKVGNVFHYSYLTKKVLKEDAFPTIEQQFYPKQHHETSITIGRQEQQPCSSDYEEQHKNLEENYNEQQPTLGEQQATNDPLDLEEQTLDNSQQQPIPNIIPQQQIQKYSDKSIDYFKNNIKKFSMLPAFWFFMEKPKELEFMRMDKTTKQIKNHIRLNEDLTITVICSNNKEISLGEKITSLDSIYEYLKSVEKWPLCVGTQIERKRYSKECKGVIFGDETYKRLQMNPRCKSCRILRCQLQSRKDTSGSISNKSVTHESLVRRCKRLKEMRIQLRKKIFKTKSECAKKSKLILAEAIKDLPEEYKKVVSSCFEAARKSSCEQCCQKILNSNHR